MVKEKTNSIRTYDEDGYRRRAACLCFRDETEQEKYDVKRGNNQHPIEGASQESRNLAQSAKILLVSSSKYHDRWVVPGGGIEPQEEPKLAAEREALEEAGAKGLLGRLLGVFENKEKKHRTSLYAFTVTDLLDEWEDAKMIGRQRKWFNIIEARNHLSHKPVQVSYLEFLSKDLNGVVK